MRSVLAAVFALLALAPASALTDWSTVTKQVAPSVVYLENPEGSCTGFVIDAVRHYVLTAAHCDAAKDEAVWVDRVRGKVVSKDTKKDLLVIEAKDLDPSRPALKLAAKNPAIGEEVMSVGYGYGLERPFYRIAHVTDTEVRIDGLGPFIGVDSGYIGGQSGGPVVNAAGEIVSIVQMASDKLGIGAGAELLKDRTGRFWTKP